LAAKEEKTDERGVRGTGHALEQNTHLQEVHAHGHQVRHGAVLQQAGGAHARARRRRRRPAACAAADGAACAAAAAAAAVAAARRRPL